jgi:acetylornithine/N-succinyldiaminopimelate aminotransferase
MLAGFRKVPFGNLSSVAQAINPQTVAIMVEPIQGEAGVVVPPQGYLKALRQLADDSGVLLILDEIQTGIARTGTLFAYQAESILPDILTLGKGLGAGFPISATLAKSKACCFDYGDQGGTFNGNPLGTSVANSVLDVVCQAEFRSQVLRVGQCLAKGLAELTARMNFKQVRGRGLLWALDLGSDIAFAVRDACLERGLIVNAARPAILRFMPSLRVTPAEVDEALDLLEASLASVLAA